MTTSTDISGTIPNAPSSEPTVGALEYFSSVVYNDIDEIEENPNSPYTFNFYNEGVLVPGLSDWSFIFPSVIGADHYQGIAYYNSKTNEVVIANRGSCSLYDFTVSDGQIAAP